MYSVSSSLDGSSYETDDSDSDDSYTESTCSRVSSGMTASDLPGAGRLLGRFYSRAGRALERRFMNKDGFILGIAPQLKAPPPVYDEEKNETMPDLDGAGRMLGLAYAVSGSLLERIMDKAALSLGKGPDAALMRIQKHVPPTRFTNIQDLRSFLFMQSLRKRGKIVDECKRLLKYARSDVPVNRGRALDHIITLAHRDSFYSTIFMRLGAAHILQGVDSDCSFYVDPFSLHSREALISLSATEIHALGQQLIIEDLRKEAAIKLVGFVQDSYDSFPALRHLAQNLAYLLDSDTFFEKLAMQLWKLDPSSRNVEWQTLDALCRRIISTTQDSLIYYSFHTKRYFISVAIPALAMAFLRLADRLPRTMSNLAKFIPWKYAAVSPTTWFPIAVYREALYKCVTMADTPFSFGVEYEKIRITVSYEVEYYVSQLLRAQALHMRNILLNLVCVIDGTIVDDLCDKIVTAAESSPGRASLQLLDCMPIIRNIDHYCWDTFKHCLTARLRVPCHATNEILSELFELDMAPIQDVWKFQTTDIHLKRAFVPETGKYHYCQLIHERVRVDGVPFWKTIILHRWWPPLPPATSQEIHSLPMESLVATYCGCLLLLPVPPGQAFSSEGHFPLLAGYGMEGENEYLAVLPDEDGAEKFCTVREGDHVVEYWDAEGARREEEDFQVLVLRFDPDDFGLEVMDEVRSDDGGMDYTGPMYWKREAWPTYCMYKPRFG